MFDLVNDCSDTVMQRSGVLYWLTDESNRVQCKILLIVTLEFSGTPVYLIDISVYIRKQWSTTVTDLNLPS